MKITKRILILTIRVFYINMASGRNKTKGRKDSYCLYKIHKKYVIIPSHWLISIGNLEDWGIKPGAKLQT